MGKRKTPEEIALETLPLVYYAEGERRDMAAAIRVDRAESDAFAAKMAGALAQQICWCPKECGRPEDLGLCSRCATLAEWELRKQ